MAKTYGSKMKSGENLSWCKPIILTYKGKKATIAQNEGTVAGLVIDGNLSEGSDYLLALTDYFGIGPAQLGEEGATSLQDLFNYLFDGASVEVEKELGCRECPFFADCDAMNEEVEDERTNLTEWQEKMMEEVEGEVFISCVMEEVPHHPNTKRFQVYNTEGTFDKLFDITLDENEEIISID